MGVAELSQRLVGGCDALLEVGHWLAREGISVDRCAFFPGGGTSRCADGLTTGGTPRDDVPRLELTARLTFGTRGADGVPWFALSDPPLASFGADGRGLNAPVALDPAPPDDLITELCRRLAAQVEEVIALDAMTMDPALKKKFFQTNTEKVFKL